MRVAVIGAGAAGLGAAWALARKHDVSVFEASDYPGGHANTRTVQVDGQSVAVDTGFIVFNEHNYPQMTQLLSHLGVAHQPSEMSFAVSLNQGGIEYEGSARGLFAQPRNLVRPSHWRMVRDILRFYRTAPDLLDNADAADWTLGDMLAHGGYSRVLAERHLLPMGAAIWSASQDDMLRFPAQQFVRFFVNHHLFAFAGRPQWRTVSGGSTAYVSRLSEALGDRLQLNNPVRALRRSPAGVRVCTDGDDVLFDQVVVASHADRALALFGSDATPEERRVLGAFRYSTNRAVLHSDVRLMPRRRSVWSSWNYIGAEAGGPLCVSYWMNRLQTLTVSTPLIVTLNPTVEPDSDRIYYQVRYDHPQFDSHTDEAQTELAALQGRRDAWFCGSYCGNGFHEDALQAGFSVAAALGAPVPWAGQVRIASEAGQRFHRPAPAAPGLAA